MVKVAVVRSWFLPVSETFIYSELVNLKNVAPIVCAKKLMNRERFPFKPVYPFRKLKDLEKIFRNNKVDLIHARFGITGAEILDIKKKLGLPMLTSFHGFDLPTNRKNRGKYNGQLRRLFEEGDAFTATSNNMKKILVECGCPKKKIFVHHSGIDVQKFAFEKRTMPADGQIRLLSVGRLVEKKGMRYLIAAFNRVQKQYPNVRLRIAGEGPLRNQLLEQVRRLDLSDKVKFLGEISHDQVVKEMKQAHLFALASTTTSNGNQEGIPNVLKEAMACGLPVVSTFHAGIPELVRDGKSGFLVPERDTDLLAQRILELIRHPEKWGKMGRKGCKTVTRKFNLQNQVPELEDIYSRVLCMERG